MHTYPSQELSPSRYRTVCRDGVHRLLHALVASPIRGKQPKLKKIIQANQMVQKSAALTCMQSAGAWISTKYMGSISRGVAIRKVE